jgi:transaldolase
VFSDKIQEMEKQALILSKISNNFNVKIPITNSKSLSTAKLISKLSSNGVVCNVTAIFTFNQVKNVMKLLPKDTKIILSIFAGRIADSGKDPEELLKKVKKYLKDYKNVKLLWASTREVFNIFQAARSGCDIITVPYGILSKLNHVGKNQTLFSLETVKMFKDDAKKAGYKI